MAMRNSQIHLGAFYTNARALFAREVIGDDDKSIVYRDYCLSDGKPISTRSQCGYSAFFRWAERECTSQEKARCDLAAMEQKTREQSEEFKGMLEVPVRYALFEVLAAIKTEYIVAYLEEMGYEVAKRE
jgi:hypothetical protein